VNKRGGGEGVESGAVRIRKDNSIDQQHVGWRSSKKRIKLGLTLKENKEKREKDASAVNATDLKGTEHKTTDCIGGEEAGVKVR